MSKVLDAVVADALPHHDAGTHAAGQKEVKALAPPAAPATGAAPQRAPPAMRAPARSVLVLDGASLTPEELMRVYYDGCRSAPGSDPSCPSPFSEEEGIMRAEAGDEASAAVALSQQAWDNIRRCRARIERHLASGKVVYGVNTGFGALMNACVKGANLGKLQVNLIRSHAAGVGEPLPLSRVKRMMAVRLNVLSKGYSGVRPETVDTMLQCLNKDCLPLVPSRGSVGASGDLAPSAHVALGLIGEGRMWNPTTERYEVAGKVLLAHGIAPVDLGAKEGLGLINGTQFMSSLCAEACVRARRAAVQADVVAACTMEALRAVPYAFDERVHRIRGQKGQVEVAERLRLLLHSRDDESLLFLNNPHNLQDAYSLRCTPQVHGAVHDALDGVEDIIRRELNAATDNPLVMEDGTLISAGNFHGEYPAKAADNLALHICEIGNISERRLERMVNPALSGPSVRPDEDARIQRKWSMNAGLAEPGSAGGAPTATSSDMGLKYNLPPFLVQNPDGINSGFMIHHCTAAALASENKVLAHPSSVDTIPTSAGQEDHVSMGAYGAVKVLNVVENVERIVAIELVAAVQALDVMQPPLPSTRRVESVRAAVRRVAPKWDEDGIACDIMNATFRLIRAAVVLRASGVRLRRGPDGWAAPGAAFRSPPQPALDAAPSRSAPAPQQLALTPAAVPPRPSAAPPATAAHHDTAVPCTAVDAAPHLRLCLHSATVVSMRGAVVEGGDPARAQKRGKAAQNDIGLLRDHSVVVGDDGTILRVGPSAEVRRYVAEVREAGGEVEREVELDGRVVMPGFVDCHTHAVHAGDRSQELAMKLAGVTYEEVTAKGGGIYFSVEQTRRASQKELEASLAHRLSVMLRHGTTTAEVKSGYGLDTETEMKMLRAVRAVAETHPVSVIPTFLGAHARPRGAGGEKVAQREAADRVIDEMIPRLAKEREDGTADARIIDVFCEDGFYDREQSLRIMRAGAAAGLRPAFHGDELNDMGSGELARECGALSVSHLEKVSEPSMRAMAGCGCVGVLLPTTAFLLRLTPPPARALIDAGVAVALGTDYNPNAPTLSMPAVLNMACVMMRLTMEEAVTAATVNAAAAVAEAHRVGSVEEGKQADLLVLSTPVWEQVVYLGMGSMDAAPTGGNLAGEVSRGCGPLIDEVVKGGRTVVRRGELVPAPRAAPAPRRVAAAQAGPDLSFLARGLVVAPLPAAEPARDPAVPHAPKRRCQLSADDARLALRNALRYFPDSVHAVLAPEFAAELREYGHIYMYRFRPRGAELREMKAYPAKSYPTRTEQAGCIIHMIMNNLDPAVAQFPHELVTYGGNGSVFQNWAQFRIAIGLLCCMTDEQCLVLYSGHPHGLFAAPRSGPRMVVTNGMVVPKYSTDDEYERMYMLGVSQYGQMTAGSFCYIGPQGIVHGTTITLLGAARKYLGVEDMAGRVFVTSGLGGMSGAQGKAGVICGAITVIAEVQEAALDKRHRQGWVTERVDDVAAVVARVRELRRAKGGGVAIGYLGNVVDLWEAFGRASDEDGEALVDLGSDQTSCHNPFGGGYYPQGMTPAEADAMAASDPAQYKERVHASLRRHIAAVNKLAGKYGMKFWDYGNALLINAHHAGAEVGRRETANGNTFRYPSYVQDIMGDIFSLGFGPFRWVCTSGDAADLAETDRIASRVIARLLDDGRGGDARGARARGCYADNKRWIDEAGHNRLVVGSQARILYSDAPGRAAIARAFNDAVRAGALRMPVVISRDHHDVSGTDSPWRETSNVYDGSSYCADMAVHNCIGDAFRGATWVALHNGGGCGWGEVINGGFGMVLDGSEEMSQRAASMLHWDVMNGVTRRAWAGNGNALATAQEDGAAGRSRPTLPTRATDAVVDAAVAAAFPALHC